jgi:hypothetical protein
MEKGRWVTTEKDVSCSLKLISPAYQLWYSVFLSQQNSINQLICRRNYQPNNPMVWCNGTWTRGKDCLIEYRFSGTVTLQLFGNYFTIISYHIVLSLKENTYKCITVRKLGNFVYLLYIFVYELWNEICILVINERGGKKGTIDGARAGKMHLQIKRKWMWYSCTYWKFWICEKTC